MHALKLVRLIGAMTVVASAPVVMAIAAHAQAPSAPPVEGQPGPRPETRPQVEPVRPTLPPTVDQKPAAGAPAAPGRTPAAPGQAAGAGEAQKDQLVGLAVFGADGQKVGEVKDVKAVDGKVEEIHVKTGGMFGFGGRTVAIPAGKFNRSGQNVQLALTSDDVAKLPRLEDKSG